MGIIKGNELEILREEGQHIAVGALFATFGVYGVTGNLDRDLHVGEDVSMITGGVSLFLFALFVKAILNDRK